MVNKIGFRTSRLPDWKEFHNSISVSRGLRFATMKLALLKFRCLFDKSFIRLEDQARLALMSYNFLN
jgi:hypothetical protein